MVLLAKGLKVDMKVKASIKARCKNCKSILRHGKRYIVCINPRHKQRQG